MISALLVASVLFATAATDRFPNGCVDCHITTPDGKNLHISTLLKKPVRDAQARVQAISPKGMKLRGKHPPANFPIKAVPAGCTNCHSGTSKSAPPMGPMMHAVHLIGDKNQFVKQFGGDCRHCHKLDTATATWKVPSAGEK